MNETGAFIVARRCVCFERMGDGSPMRTCLELLGMTRLRWLSLLGLGLAPVVALAAPAHAADEPAKVTLTLKDHRFSPAEPTAPAGKPIVIEVTNLDSTPSEFESKPLRVEKVVPAGGKVTVQVRPLSPGRYRFFDDYHEATAEGFLVTK